MIAWKILVHVAWLTGLCLPMANGSSLSDPSSPGRIHYITLPSSGNGPCDIDTGPDGVSVYYRQLVPNSIGVYNTSTKQVKEFVIPDSDPPNAGNSSQTDQCWLRTGQDGLIYSGNPTTPQIYRLDPKSETIKTFTLTTPDLYPTWIEAYAAKNGLYLTSLTGNRVALLSYKTGKFTSILLPTPGSGPYGINVDTEGIVYFTEYAAQKIAKLDPKTDKLTEFALPLPLGQGPAIMRAVTQQKFFWIIGANGLIRLNTATQDTSKAIKIISYSGSFDQDEADPQGRVWLSSAQINKLIYYTPSTGEFTTITLPGGGAEKSHWLPVHYGPLNSMWFTNLASGQLGYYRL